MQSVDLLKAESHNKMLIFIWISPAGHLWRLPHQYQDIHLDKDQTIIFQMNSKIKMTKTEDLSRSLYIQRLKIYIKICITSTTWQHTPLCWSSLHHREGRQAPWTRLDPIPAENSKVSIRIQSRDIRFPNWSFETSINSESKRYYIHRFCYIDSNNTLYVLVAISNWWYCCMVCFVFVCLFTSWW